MPGLGGFITNNPSIPILAGAGIGGLTPFLIEKLRNTEKEKYKRKNWHHLVGLLLGSGAGAGATWLGTNVADMGTEKQGGLMAEKDLNDFYLKMVKEAAEDLKIDIGGDKVNIGELIRNLELKQQHGGDIRVPESPTVESIEPMPALWSEDPALEAVDGDVELSIADDIMEGAGAEELGGVSDVESADEVMENATSGKGFNEEVTGNEEDTQVSEEIKEANRKYIEGMNDYLLELGVKEADRKMLISKALGID